MNITVDIEVLRERKYSLLKDFCITITSEIERGINKCNNRTELDKYCHDVIMNHLNN